jgi:hypothetical protein
MMLADELFCIAHDDRTGRCRLHPRVLGLGLAAGLLGELVLWGRLDVRDGQVRVLRGDPPADALAHATVELLVAQPQYRDVAVWLAFLAETSVESVARRLTVAGVWRAVEQRRWGRTRIGRVPVDGNAVVWRSMRLARLLTSGGPMTVPDVVLAGLVQATGLTDVVLWQPATREVGRARVDHAVGGLPWPLYHLVAHAQAAIGDAVLTPR